MIRMWVKFKEQSGKQVIDKATFQSFGCETAIAVASLATELIRGKTAEEVLAMSGEQLAPSLGPLPPVRIHCTQLVETALHAALRPQPASKSFRAPRGRDGTQFGGPSLPNPHNHNPPASRRLFFLAAAAK